MSVSLFPRPLTRGYGTRGTVVEEGRVPQIANETSKDLSVINKSTIGTASPFPSDASYPYIGPYQSFCGNVQSNAAGAVKRRSEIHVQRPFDFDDFHHSLHCGYLQARTAYPSRLENCSTFVH
eukprot:scaffold4420_cov107-Cylindrotheca_fusiformis.AAC.5